MTQLRRTKGDDQHLYIMLGPSKGTRQITEAGESWLKNHKYFFPSPGGWVNLDVGDYHYLEKHDYLYIKGEEYQTSPTSDLASLLPSPEAVQYGPPLLLQLADNHQQVTRTQVEWKLVLKLDEWGENAKNELLRNSAAAVGCYIFSETDATPLFSSISLQHILKADYWPEVAPKISDYELYWQTSELYQKKSQSPIRLREATPTTGLKPEWQGNVFFKSGDFANTWKRYLPGMSSPIRDFRECYWLAQSDQEPAPPWPGLAQRIGQARQGWQLWHLQVDQQANIEDLAEWFWYRQIQVRYPAWKLSLLNPLSMVSEREYTCLPGQQLLLRCDPPTPHTENMQACPTLSLTRYTQTDSGWRQSPGTPALSPPLGSDLDGGYFFRIPAPPTHQKYRISISGGASALSLWVRTSPPSTQLPDWLCGLSCSVVIADKQFTMQAFRSKPAFKSVPYQLSAGVAFSSSRLGDAIWHYHPAGIPCVLRWEYPSPQGEYYQTERTFQTEAALTNWWQTVIWPDITDSPWVTLTLDAASLGNIHLMLMLKPEVPSRQEPKRNENCQANTGQESQNMAHPFSNQEMKKPSTSRGHQQWWMLRGYTAYFFWLSRIAEQDAPSMQQAVIPKLSQTLEQLCTPELPAALKDALQRLAMSGNMPVWMRLRLQTVLTTLHSTSELIAEE